VTHARFHIYPDGGVARLRISVNSRGGLREVNLEEFTRCLLSGPNKLCSIVAARLAGPPGWPHKVHSWT